MFGVFGSVLLGLARDPRGFFELGKGARMLLVEMRPSLDDRGAVFGHLLQPRLRAMNLFMSFKQVTHNAVELIDPQVVVVSVLHNFLRYAWKR